MPAASATPTSAAPATGSLVTAIWRIGHARPRRSDRSGADQGEPDRRQRTWPSPSSRPADGCGMVGLAADLRLCDRASRRRDSDRYGRVSGPQAVAALASLFPLCRTIRHRAGRGGGAAVAGARNRSKGCEAHRADPFAHRSRRRTAGVPEERSPVRSGRDRDGLAGRLRGYLPDRWPKDFDPKPLTLEAVAYGPFARSKSLTKDGAIVAVATPGHTRDHLSVVVEDGDATVFIADDAS